MTSTDEELVSRLQAHLSTIRKAAGWSGERLANELGITKQTVSSLETGKNADDEDALSRHQGGIQQRNRRQRKRGSGKNHSAIR